VGGENTDISTDKCDFSTEWSIAVFDSQRALNLVAGQDHDNPCLWMLKTFTILFIDVNL
jgi:hypothetical protein